jgi:hypothetical protein
VGWAGWAERVRVRGFVFFLFFFKPHFQIHFQFKTKSNFLQTFLKYFIGFLETTQATKTMQAK